MCTTVIVGRLASTTGRVILGHNEDSGGRCMHQQFWVPGGSHSAGEFVEGEPGRARVPQAPVTLGTYWSNMLAPAPGSSFDQGMANDAGVVMCSNSGGDSYDGHLSDEEVGLFEGGIGFLLRRCVMERAHTAREAVEIAGELISKYGYWSPARNYSFADAQEAWVLNVVKGKHFVAHRVPDDKVVLISNYLAIRVVDFSDTENVIASPDLIDYAVKKGRFSPAAGSYYHEFDFSVAYQPDEIRLDPNKSIRMRTGWQYITGEVFDDPNHYPEMVTPPHKMSVEDVKAVLRLTAEETYRTRGDGRADAFHASAQDISRAHTRESWVADIADDPLYTVLWRCSSSQDPNPYVPWFPMAGEIPQGYQWSTLEDARRFHFSMPADMLDFNEDHSWFIYGSLSEIVNFNRGLMAGIWPVRDSLEAEFIGAAEKVKHEAETLPHAEAKKLLGDFTCRMCAKADETYRELRDALTIDAADVVLADAEAVDISVSDPNALVAITLTPAVESSELDLDPNSVLWSLGFSGKKESVLAPAKPISSAKNDDGSWTLSFRANEVARWAVPGCFMDTYIRGFVGHRRFVSQVNFRFTA